MVFRDTPPVASQDIDRPTTPHIGVGRVRVWSGLSQNADHAIHGYQHKLRPLAPTSIPRDLHVELCPVLIAQCTNVGRCFCPTSKLYVSSRSVGVMLWHTASLSNLLDCPF